jgi:hypothetical protein
MLNITLCEIYIRRICLQRIVVIIQFHCTVIALHTQCHKYNGC